MSSYNFVMLSGRVMTPPRRQYRPDGSTVIEFPLELNETNGQSQKKSKINIVAIGKLAEKKSELLECGKHLLVKGRLNQRQWKTPDGRRRMCFEVIATELKSIEENKKIKEKENEKTC